MNITDRYNKINDEGMFRYFYLANGFSIVELDMQNGKYIALNGNVAMWKISDRFDISSRTLLSVMLRWQLPGHSYGYMNYFRFNESSHAAFAIRMLYEHIRDHESKAMVSKFLKRRSSEKTIMSLNPASKEWWQK